MWLNNFKEEGKDNIPIYLVGNKCDEDNKVENNLIEDLKNRNGIEDYINTSAKDNIGIEELFNDLAEKIYNKFNI